MTRGPEGPVSVGGAPEAGRCQDGEAPPGCGEAQQDAKPNGPPTDTGPAGPRPRTDSLAQVTSRLGHDPRRDPAAAGGTLRAAGPGHVRALSRAWSFLQRTCCAACCRDEWQTCGAAGGWVRLRTHRGGGRAAEPVPAARHARAGRARRPALRAGAAGPRRAVGRTPEGPRPGAQGADPRARAQQVRCRTAVLSTEERWQGPLHPRRSSPHGVGARRRPVRVRGRARSPLRIDNATRVRPHRPRRTRRQVDRGEPAVALPSAQPVRR